MRDSNGCTLSTNTEVFEKNVFEPAETVEIRDIPQECKWNRIVSFKNGYKKSMIKKYEIVCLT